MKRRKDFLAYYDRCPEHGCPLMQVTADAAPVCLMDWLRERYCGRYVVDVVPHKDRYGDLVMGNGMTLPVLRIWSRNPQKVRPLWNAPREGVRLLAVCALRLVEAAYRNDRLLLKFSIADLPYYAYGEAELAALLDVLQDEEVRKYEP